MNEKIKNKIEKYFTKENKKIFVILFCLFCVEMFAFLRINVLYSDDIGHTVYGYKDWHLLSRYTTSVLSNVFSIGNYMTDISPLSNILAALMLTISGMILIKLFDNNKIHIIWKIIAVLPIGLCPFFLQNISFKVDMPYMTAAILFSILPFISYNNKKIFFILSVICTFFMLTTYQAASGIYIVIIFLIFFDGWLFKKKKIKYLLLDCFISLIAYLLACIIFRYCFMDVSNAYRTVDSLSIKDFLPGIYNNLTLYCYNIWNAFKNIWRIILVIILVFFIYYTTKSSKQNKVLSCGASILFILVSFCSTFGIYIVLKNPAYDMRSFMAIGIYISLILLYILKLNGNVIFKICIVVLNLSFIVFAYQYTNLLKKNNDYEEYIIKSIIKDLNKLDCVKYDSQVELIFTNEMHYSPIVLSNVSDDENILYGLIPIAINDASPWWGFQKMKYYNLLNIYPNETDDPNTIEFYPYIDNINYKIEIDNTCAKIKDKNKKNYKKYIHIIFK